MQVPPVPLGDPAKVWGAPRTGGTSAICRALANRNGATVAMEAWLRR